MRLRDSFAQAMSEPRTAPTRKPQLATATVMPAAISIGQPQPFGPKPISSK